MLAILMFSVDKFSRQHLDKMSDSERYNLAAAHRRNGDAIVCSVDVFCDACNDEEIDIDKWWMYTANV